MLFLRHSMSAASSTSVAVRMLLKLCRLIWGLADARVNPGDAWLLSFCKAAQAKFFISSPAELAVEVYGLARLGYRPPDIWISAWLEASEPLLAGFSPQNLSNAAWGLSCWRYARPSADYCLFHRHNYTIFLLRRGEQTQQHPSIYPLPSPHTHTHTMLT